VDNYPSIRRRRSISPLIEYELREGESAREYEIALGRHVHPLPRAPRGTTIPAPFEEGLLRTESPIEERERDREEELQSDKDITAMQLAKYTGRVAPSLQPTVNISITRSAGNQARSPLFAHSEIGALKSRATYVEDTIDDDDDNKFIHGRIYEIHEEPEELIITQENTQLPQDTTNKIPTSTDPIDWTWAKVTNQTGANTKNDGGDATANPGGGATETPAAGDDEWANFSLGTTKKKGKKKKKKPVTADPEKWYADDEWGQGGGASSSAVPENAAKTQAYERRRSRERGHSSEDEDGAKNRAEARRKRRGQRDDERKREGADDDDEKNWSWGSSNKRDWDNWEKRRHG